MFGFGNWWQSLWTNGCLEFYLKDLSIGFSWSPFVGFKESLWWPRCYSRNYLKIGHVRGWSRLSQRVNQVDQHTKHRRCTERDQAIPWYGKHCQLRFVYYPWSSWGFFVGLGCGVQVQVEHHEEIKCLKLVVLCGDNGPVKMCGRVAHP